MHADHIHSKIDMEFLSISSVAFTINSSSMLFGLISSHRSVECSCYRMASGSIGLFYKWSSKYLLTLRNFRRFIELLLNFRHTLDVDDKENPLLILHFGRVHHFLVCRK